MFVECVCNNCPGHIEFEESNAGQTVACPHCGIDTVLYVPSATPLNSTSTAPSPPPVASPSTASLRTCRDCGQPVSIHAEFCPHCGATYKRKRGVFFYVFWGVISLIATGIILTLVLIFLGVGIPAFFGAKQAFVNARDTAENERQASGGQKSLPTPSQNTQRNLQEAAQIKAEATALLVSGRFLRLTDEIDESVTIEAKPTQQDITGLSLRIGIPKQGKPILALVALDVTGKNSNSERQAISGFDKVRCRIGTNVFSLQEQWSPGHVTINIGETWQSSGWTVPEDAAATDLLLHILNSDSPIKVEFSSSFMGGSSYTFTMTEKQIQAIKDVFTIYESLPDAALLKINEPSR